MHGETVKNVQDSLTGIN